MHSNTVTMSSDLLNTLSEMRKRASYWKENEQGRFEFDPPVEHIEINVSVEPVKKEKWWKKLFKPRAS